MATATGVECDTPASENLHYDVVTIGFGPASLAQAVALYEQRSGSKHVLILEKSPGFSWRGEDLPMGRTRMRTNLMQDLVTARNPKSKFSFVNYLWATDNLVGYTNLGLVNPPRVLFDMYLRWCAKQFDDLGWTRYGREVLAVEAVSTDSGAFGQFRIKARDVFNDTVDHVFAKKVIVAPGMTKGIPPALSQPELEEAVWHSSDLSKFEPKVLQARETCLDIAIIGISNEGIDVLDRLMGLPRQVKITLFSDGNGVRQTDENPFAGNAILASNTIAFEHLHRQLGHGRSQPSLQSDDLSCLYIKHYGQRIRKPSDSQSLFDVVQFNKLIGAQKAGTSDALMLQFQNTVNLSTNSFGPYKFVISASGYSRGLHEQLLQPLKEYFDDRAGGLTVNADYRVNLDRRFVDPAAGIWMLDGFENGPDDAFSFMALRAERVLRSMVAADKNVVKDGEQKHGKQEPIHRAAL